MITRRGFLKLLGAGFASVAGFFAYATGIEAMGRPRLQPYALKPPRWSDGLKLKVVVLADIHATNPWMDADRVRAICRQANEQAGDIVLLLGDFVNAMIDIGEWVPNADVVDALSELRAPLGIYAVLGNHDYWHDSSFETDPDRLPAIARRLNKSGMPVLVNDALRLEKDGKPFWIAGLGDQLALVYSQLVGPTHEEGMDDLPSTMAKITDDAPVILMAHEPDIFPSVTDRVSLTLSGHTHGGQINIFGWSPILNSKFGKRYRGGQVVEDGRHIIISRGLGCTGAPVRVGVRPEIVVLDLG